MTSMMSGNETRVPMRRIISCLIVLCIGTILSACQSGNSKKANITSKSVETAVVEETALLKIEGCKLLHDKDKGNIIVNITVGKLNSLGFAFGDSLDIEFSNGYKLSDVPYYNDAYVFDYKPVVIGESDDKDVLIELKRGDDLYEKAGLTENDTVTIIQNESQKYIKRQIAMDIEYTDERSDYNSDEVFANFRSVSAGNIKKNILYRSASPCDNRFKRAPYSDKLAKVAGVNFVMNMSDDKEHLDYYISKKNFNSPYYKSLYEKGNIVLLSMMVDYHRDDFAPKLVKGFTELSKHKGPYLIHCIEGKDRTGFACLVLEALAGASYQELLNDYMITYDNYFEINKDTDQERYDALVETSFEPMLIYLSGESNVEKLLEIDYSKYAREYLLKSGMSEESLNELIDRMVK